MVDNIPRSKVYYIPDIYKTDTLLIGYIHVVGEVVYYRKHQLGPGEFAQGLYDIFSEYESDYPLYNLSLQEENIAYAYWGSSQGFFHGKESTPIIKSIRELKHSILPDATLILFGSQARQDATSESDWDMLILLNKEKVTPDDFEKYAYPFVELGWKLGEYFSMKLYTVSEWMNRKGTPFFKNVETEGVKL